MSSCIPYCQLFAFSALSGIDFYYDINEGRRRCIDYVIDQLYVQQIKVYFTVNLIIKRLHFVLSSRSIYHRYLHKSKCLLKYRYANGLHNR